MRPRLNARLTEASRGPLGLISAGPGSRKTVLLMMSSRSDPFLAMHRYRLAGQMYEVRAADLAMTKGEAHALLSAQGVRLPSRELTLLTDRTEGWAAGLRLSAMSMAQSRHPA